MNFETLLFEEKESIGILKINRPKALNALNQQVLSELSQFFDQIEDMKSVKCIIITGNSEKSFVAGADIKEFQGLGKDQAAELARRGQKTFDKVEACSKPVIAAVNGFALGGGLELALSCDFIICHNKARFGLPEVSLGIMPGFGGTQRLRQAVGLRKAREMTFTGGHYDALAAKEMGLVNRVAEPEMLMDACFEIANQIKKQAPVAISEAKRAIFEGQELSQEKSMELEAEIFGGLFETKDSVEGVAAFVEKRKPEFSGE